MLDASISRLGVAEGEELETNILRNNPVVSSRYKTVPQRPFFGYRLNGERLKPDQPTPLARVSRVQRHVSRAAERTDFL